MQEECRVRRIFICIGLKMAQFSSAEKFMRPRHLTTNFFHYISFEACNDASFLGKFTESFSKQDQVICLYKNCS